MAVIVFIINEMMLPVQHVDIRVLSSTDRLIRAKLKPLIHRCRLPDPRPPSSPGCVFDTAGLHLSECSKQKGFNIPGSHREAGTVKGNQEVTTLCVFLNLITMLF